MKHKPKTPDEIKLHDAEVGFHFYMPRHLLREFKMKAAKDERPMKKIMIELVREWVRS